ncbi:MAG: tetratricopeptide repeat protein, partial [Acidobacteriota bacterium]
AHIALGRRLLMEGQPGPAATAFGKAASINPEHVAARVEEAQSLILTGRYADARRRLEDGLARLPKAAEIAHALARLLATAPDAAVRDGDRALNLAGGVLEAYPWPSHAETYVMALAELGRFDGILSEGADQVLNGRSQNRVYVSPSAGETRGMKLLLKNYGLSDDIAFRFSNQNWSQWPLTPGKFADWVTRLEAPAQPPTPPPSRPSATSSWISKRLASISGNPPASSTSSISSPPKSSPAAATLSRHRPTSLPKRAKTKTPRGSIPSTVPR